MKKIKLACIGAGYFARFHVEAWQRIPEVELLAICDQQMEKAKALAAEFGVSRCYAEVSKLLEHESLDVVDIITPPDTHVAICRQLVVHGIHIICQKPLAPTVSEARELVALVEQHQLRFMVHENFRFQPWYRKVRSLLDHGVIGRQLHTVNFRMRMGDGWQTDAYLQRQPYFRTMPRLLVYETGIHFIDVFRFLMGEVKAVFADLRRLNPAIAGEDCGMVFFYFQNGATGIWDANRYNESNASNARYTFGEMLLEGAGGSIRLYTDGRLTVQTLGQAETVVEYTHNHQNFAGDCVYFTQCHFIDCLLQEVPFEIEGRAYLKNLEVQEAIYNSSAAKRIIEL